MNRVPSRSRRQRFATMPGRTLAMLLVLGGAPEALAQDDVAASGMGQGEARITARSDVRMRVDSGPGTSGVRLQRMVAALSAKLDDIRRCYADVTSERPSVTGDLRVDLRLANRPRPALDTLVDTASDAALTRCVQRQLARADFRDVERPAQVRVELSFRNTAAAGIEALEERSAVEAQVAVTREGGRLVAHGGTPDRHVRFVIRGSEASTEAQIAALHRSVRANIAGLLDCRRRAGRRNMSSEGTVELSLMIPRRGRLRYRTQASTLEDPRAPACIGRALQQGRFEEAAQGVSELHVAFSAAPPASPDPG